MCLAAATAFIAIRRGLRIGAVVVDHGLQQGSAEVADAARDLAEVRHRRGGRHPVQVGDRGGPEAAARDARYAALRQQAQEDRGAGRPARPYPR
jgi:tRNA(Ile)-lysidine synthase